METIKIINPKLTEAKYTKLLKDIDDEFIDQIQDSFNEFDEDDKLLDMFLRKYRYYEICDKEESVFVQCVRDVFYEYLDYYTELLTNYNKEYDYALGNKKTMTRTDTTESNKNGTVAAENDNVHREYDLPNKVVDASSEDGYLTAKDTNKGSSSASTEENNSSEYGSSIETVYHDEFLDLKRKYLNQIRNVYEEFADKFKDCFLHIY